MAHVPRFGNWDADNVPYSAYFDNARRQSSITRSKDSEVFSNKINDDVDASRASSHSRSRSHRRHREGRSNARRHQLHHLKSMRTQEASEISKFDDSVMDMDNLKLGKYQGGNDNNSYNNNMAAIFSSPSRQIKLRDSTKTHSSQHANKEGTLVPEFGGWDVTDAKSTQGYTAIFRKIRQEKQSVKRRPQYLPNNNTQPLNNNIQNQCNTSSSKFSKLMTQCCCCLFPHATK